MGQQPSHVYVSRCAKVWLIVDVITAMFADNVGEGVFLPPLRLPSPPKGIQPCTVKKRALVKSLPYA